MTTWSEKWMRQGDADYQAMEISKANKRFEWACFAAQQASEKYLKAFLFEQGQRVITTHSLRKLILEASDHDPAFSDLLDAAKLLDNYYFTTRYPDALPDDTPADYFSVTDAQKAQEAAMRIKALVEKTCRK